MRDHGGNLDWAQAHYGGAPGDWLDLSTGINRLPWPVPALPPRAWTDLPTRADMAALCRAASRAYGASGALCALSGASQAIQLIPRLTPPGLARVLSPTYNEHAAALRAAGWRVEPVTQPEALAGADLGIIVNPNNPDGQRHDPARLLDLQPRVGRLVVDESFGEVAAPLSLASATGRPGLIVLRSFGKFYGLAGLRLGFALGDSETIAALADLAGPWPVTGPAITIGQAALADTGWQAATRARLAADAARMDALCPWPLIGGSDLFRLYRSPDAVAAQAGLARGRVWSRIFPHDRHAIRLGLPAPQEWDRLATAFDGLDA